MKLLCLFVTPHRCNKCHFKEERGKNKTFRINYLKTSFFILVVYHKLSIHFMLVYQRYQIIDSVIPKIKNGRNLWKVFNLYYINMRFSVITAILLVFTIQKHLCVFDFVICWLIKLPRCPTLVVKRWSIIFRNWRRHDEHLKTTPYFDRLRSKHLHQKRLKGTYGVSALLYNWL